MLNEHVGPDDDPGSDAASPVRHRSILVRCLFSLLWFVPIYFITNMLIGAIVGGIAGSSETTFEDGQAAGYAASVQFFQQYGYFVLPAQVVATGFLAWFELLPGTRRSKEPVT